MDTLGLQPSQWLEVAIGVASVVLALTLGRWVINLILRRWLESLAERTQTTLDDAFVESLPGPVTWYLVVAVAQWALGRLDFIPARYGLTIERVFFVAYAVIVFVFLWVLIRRLFEWYGSELGSRSQAHLNEQLLPILRRVSLIVLTLITLTSVLQHFNVEIGGLLATLGVGSLAIALAAQASLSDIFSGFVIMVDRPYRIGDRIELQDLSTWGDVVDIGLRSTRVRTMDNRMVIIPNALIGKSPIINHSYPDSHYRIQTVVGVAYGTDIDLARKTMIEAAQKVEGVRSENPVEALLLEIGESSLNFSVRVWIESYADTRRVVDRVNSALYKALAAAGVSIPFPQRDVHHFMSGQAAESLGGMLGPAIQAE
jgi:MscS family membrane protein